MLSAVALAAAPSVLYHAGVASYGTGQVPHLSDYVLLRSFATNQKNLGFRRQLIVPVALRQEVGHRQGCFCSCSYCAWQSTEYLLPCGVLEQLIRT